MTGKVGHVCLCVSHWAHEHADLEQEELRIDLRGRLLGYIVDPVSSEIERQDGHIPSKESHPRYATLAGQTTGDTRL